MRLLTRYSDIVNIYYRCRPSTKKILTVQFFEHTFHFFFFVKVEIIVGILFYRSFDQNCLIEEIIYRLFQDYTRLHKITSTD